MAKPKVQTRYGKINAILNRKLVRPAMPSDAVVAFHNLRARRRTRGLHLSQHVDITENPDGWWKKAGRQIGQRDPELKRAGALLHKLMTS